MPSTVFRCSLSAVLAAVLLVAGCGPKKVGKAPPSPAAPAMAGPAYLRETIGSLVRVRDFQPQLVSGYGLVVLPQGSGTGSSYVPVWLRQKMINDMRKMGMGSSRLNTENLSPLRVLADPDTVIVEVFGFVPPGAVPGTTFDVIVKALDEDVDATSLAGGVLWTTELAPGGANRSNMFIRPVADARGPAYINPFDDRPEEERQYDFRRRALVVAGGKTLEARPIQLVLNQPSWSNSRLIADRINDHFSRTTDRQLVAEAQTDLLINVNVPARFADNPARLMELIAHTYVRHGGGFEAQQAKTLAGVLERNSGNTAIARDVMLCWQAMGRAAIPVLREYYEATDTQTRLAALKAGAWLGDERAGEPLADLTRSDDANTRILAAESLVHLPRNVAGFAALKALLNDDDVRVRIAAYETLAANDDNILGRTLIHDDQDVKFIIDRVPSDKPLIYVTPNGFPRVVIFQPDMAFDPPMLASLWDSKLLMRLDAADVPLEVYYRPAPGVAPRTLKAEPMVATLAYMLGHRPSMDQPNEGLDLTFGQVADALYTLCKDGTIPAPIEVRTSPLARLVEEIPTQPSPQRPESGDRPESAPTPDAPAEATTSAAPAVRPETGG